MPYIGQKYFLQPWDPILPVSEVVFLGQQHTMYIIDSIINHGHSLHHPLTVVLDCGFYVVFEKKKILYQC